MSRIGLRNSMRIRWCSTSQTYAVTDNVKDLLETEELKHRNHPGIVKPKQILAPSWLLNAIRNIITDNKLPAKAVVESGQRLANHLNGRHLPFEDTDLNSNRSKTKRSSQEKNVNTNNDVDKLETLTDQEQIRNCSHKWRPTLYDKMTSLSYLAGRSLQDYTVLYRILNDIKVNDPDFTPKTLLDFGSGVGTVLWVAPQIWGDSLKEYLCVDISAEMNNLSVELIKQAKPVVNRNNIFYRQFFPVDIHRNYDIVISAYSLFELDSLKSRIEMISKLWNRTSQYLILIEQGTNAGFTAIHEARDFVLNYTKFKPHSPSGYVFAPCPTDLKCPRYRTDNTPCNFEVNYQSLPLSGNSYEKRERYSYVVIKKGERPEDDCKWPRIVRPTLVRGKHVVCRVCTPSGELQEHIFTKFKNGRHTYRCARNCNWGDRLPFKLTEEEK